MSKITPFLTFKEKGEEAVNFYVSVFKNSKVRSIMNMDGKLVHASFQLDDQLFMAMDGGEPFHFAIGTSLFVTCEDQEEVDYFWEKLSEGGSTGRCGWLTDRYGVSWQIVPALLGKLMSDKDRTKAVRVRDAVLAMNKLDCAVLQAAYDGK